MKSAVFFLALAGSALAQSAANSSVPIITPSAVPSAPATGRNLTVTTASVTATKTRGAGTGASSSGSPATATNGAAAVNVGAGMMAAFVGLIAVAL